MREVDMKSDDSLAGVVQTDHGLRVSATGEWVIDVAH